jgi:plastocyanin
MGALIAAAGVVALGPTAAQAATRTVDMGTPVSAQQSFRAVGADVNDFFPHVTRIHVGDKVEFAPVGFHTVNLPAKGQDPDPLVAPTGTTISGLNDEAGSPFWFNGQPQLAFNPALAPPGLYGKTVAYNGTKGVQSGLPLGEDLDPVTVRFKKAGSFKYYCTVHPGMRGKVVVSRRSHRVPSARQHAKAIKRQIKRDLNIAKRLPQTKVPTGTVDVGVAGPHGVEYLGMLPAEKTVPVGTRLTFRMTPGSYEDHTATFGPGNPESEPSSYLGVLAAGFNAPVFDQRAVYPSESPAGAGATLTPTLHGNGFWNTGVMDRSIRTPLPESDAVTFGAPGTYTYYCLIHTFMRGTITVQ